MAARRAGGTLVAASGASGDVDVSTAGSSEYTADPDALPATFYEGSGDDIWRADARTTGCRCPTARASDSSAPLDDDDTTVMGSGSVDLCDRADADDTDLEVTVSAPPGRHRDLRAERAHSTASQRQLDTAASTDLRRCRTHLEADTAPLVAGEVTPVHVELFPVAHPFRAGHRHPAHRRRTGQHAGRVGLRHHRRRRAGHRRPRRTAHPSTLVLPVVRDVDIATDAPPACGALRGQPCRRYEPAANGG